MSQVPVPDEGERCGGCGGRGTVFDRSGSYHRPEKQCPRCGGTGKTTPAAAPVAELLACPFCGGDARHEDDSSEYRDASYWAACCDCGAEGGWGNSKERAAELWNRRTPAPTSEPPTPAGGSIRDKACVTCNGAGVITRYAPAVDEEITFS